MSSAKPLKIEALTAAQRALVAALIEAAKKAGAREEARRRKPPRDAK